jgi:hypothetical protein
MNRPDASYLWSYLCVYCLLILKSVAEMRQGILPIVIIATLVLPTSIDAAKDRVYGYLGKEKSYRGNDGLLWGWHTGRADGLVIPNEVCESPS